MNESREAADKAMTAWMVQVETRLGDLELKLQALTRQHGALDDDVAVLIDGLVDRAEEGGGS